MLKDILYGYEQDFFSKNFCNISENLEKRLHKDFKEYGKSGKIISRNETITALKEITTDRKIEIKNFQCTLIYKNIALVHYTSIHNKNLQVLRTSIWKKEDNYWQLYFHQGTIKNK